MTASNTGPTQMSCDIKDKVKFILDFMSGTSIG